MDNIGLLGFESAVDLYHKLERDYKKLQKEECSDNYMNFIFTANHLREWIKNDPSLDDEFKANAEKELDNSNYNIFNNLANRGKHFKTTNRQRVDTEDGVTPGVNFNELDFNQFAFNSNREYLVKVNGQELLLSNECKTMFEKYEEIFNKITK
jgi:hypothetical protein